MKKTVFITGVSRGIGKALAEKFLKENYEIIGTSTSGKSNIKDKKLKMLKLNLSSPESIDKCVKNFKSMDKKIDIIVNNAGIWSEREDNVMSIENLRKILEVNLIGTIDITERLIHFVNNNCKIINISSTAGSLTKTKDSNYPDYKISKVALNMYTRTLAIRLKQMKVLVASIHPGWVKTDMGGNNADIYPDEAIEYIYKRIITLKETGQFWFKQNKLPW